MIKKITSLQNPIIKDVIKLQEKSRERKKRGIFIIEGKRELSLAQKGNYEIETVLFVTEIITLEELEKSIPNNNSLSIIEITAEIYHKIAYRDSTEGVISIVKTKEHTLQSVQLPAKNPLVLVLESIEKPGNIGAILRTADAANMDAVFIADPKTDLYNPNIIRSSVGCVFTNQIIIATSEDIISFLKKQNITIYSATLQNSNEYCKEDYRKPSAIVVGTEATGLTKIWRENATKNINIPMQGEIDSMNVSVACAIITFEAVRQRSLNK